MSAIAKSQKPKAEAFVAEAEKALKKSSWFTSKDKKYEDAAELYEQAANAYKVGGFNQEAGDTYTKAAELHRDHLSNFNEASKDLSSAGACYKKISPSNAIDAYQAAIALYTDAGRLNQAAKLSKECAEIFENEEITRDGKSNVVLAIEAYEQASELFGLEDAKSSSSACMTKIAELLSAALDPPDLLRAAQIYEEQGNRCLESNLLKFNAKGYFLQAIFCHLANGDSVGASQAISRYEGTDYTFGESREGKLCQSLIESVEAQDEEAFSSACYEYDQISKLDPWKTSMLVKVKRTIEGGGEGDDEEDLDALM